MTEKTCRDCGNLLAQTARGCPQCALNFEAENMIDRFVWRRFMPSAVVLGFVIVALIWFLR